MNLKSVPRVISSMTLVKVSATLDIVTTKIGSWADVRAGCPGGELSGSQQGSAALNSVASMDTSSILQQ
jgi:hypothetical protein